MTLEVRSAGENCREDIRRLLDGYLAELSTYGEVDHTYPYFEAYWTEGQARWPFLILGDGKLVGFAFVNTVSPSGRRCDFSMAEFYIHPSARGKGYGIAAAKELMLKFSGLWELSIMQANKPAQRFWPKAISEIEGRDTECFERNGDTIHRFSV
ncbi:MAG: hypothetical protein CMI60_11550 [Parvibaculum sp.]|nr:hypothetical protein [Parvibaculum sp.]